MERDKELFDSMRMTEGEADFETLRDIQMNLGQFATIMSLFEEKREEQQ